MTPPHDDDHDHAGHDHPGHDHGDHEGHDHASHEGTRASGPPPADPARYAGLEGWVVDDVSSCVKELRANIPADRYAAAVEAAARGIARRVTLRGFRPGKAPVSRVKQLYAKDVAQSAVGAVVQETWDEVQKELALRPVSTPTVTEMTVREGEPMLFAARIEVLPVRVIAGLDSVVVTPKVVRVSEEDVDREMEAIRASRARLVSAESTEAHEGQVAVVTLMRWPQGGARMDAPKETQDSLLVEIGHERNLPEMDQALRGMAPGEMRDFEAAVPTGAGGATAATPFRVLLKELRDRKLPDADDELAAGLGMEGVTTLARLREEVRERLLSMRQQVAQREQEAEAMDLLLRQNPLEMPPSLVEKEAETRLRRGVEDLVKRGIDPERAAIDWNAEIARARDAAERDLRADWLLELCARQREIEVTDRDVQAEIDAMAKENNVSPAALRRDLEKDKRISSLHASIRRRRTLDLLRSGATISVE
jgi:trigger factor